jgi:murein L,D-transpeptidase YafK
MRKLRTRGLHYGAPIFLRIFKASKELELWVQAREQFRLFRIYTICAASGRLGPKEHEGDLQSPEGFYMVTPERMNPDSQYHLSFDLGYPNTYDQSHGRTGSALMVHGNCVSAGCYAMTDADIEEIYTLADAALRSGQPSFAVHIFPFRMSQKYLRHFRSSRWLPFWLNLKEGYDYFARTRRPPLVLVHAQRYVFPQLLPLPAPPERRRGAVRLRPPALDERWQHVQGLLDQRLPGSSGDGRDGR